MRPHPIKRGEHAIAGRPLSRAAFLRFLHSSSGSSAIEYSLIAGLVGIGIVGAIVGYQQKLFSILNDVSNVIGNYS